jgi:hypothetical protein
MVARNSSSGVLWLIVLSSANGAMSGDGIMPVRPLATKALNSSNRLRNLASIRATFSAKTDRPRYTEGPWRCYDRSGTQFAFEARQEPNSCEMKAAADKSSL